MAEDVIRLEHRVGFKLSAPIAVGVLLIEKIIPRPQCRAGDFLQRRIHSSEFRGGGLCYCSGSGLRCREFLTYFEYVHRFDNRITTRPAPRARNRFELRKGLDAHRACNRSRRDRLHNLRRQTEAHILWHHFYFFDAAETLLTQIIDHVLNQHFRCRCAGR